MLRHFVRSFLLATAFSSVATAGPCRPRPASTSISTEGLTQSVTSSVVPIDTRTLSNSDTISQDAATGTGASINPTDASLTLSNIYPISTATTEDVDVSTDWYPYLPITSATYEDGTSSTAAPVSFATDTSSSIGPESIISHTTGTTLTTASETASSSAVSTDTTATSSDTAIETQLTLSAATDTTSTGSDTQSISADTTATSGEVDATSTIGTETTTSVAIDTTVGTSGTDSSLASSSDTTTDSGEASSTTTSATSTGTTEESKATDTTTTTSSDHSTAGTDSSTPTSENVSTDITMTSSETTAMSSQIDATATTETDISTVTTEAISSDTTVTSKGTDTMTATSSNATAATETLTSTAESASTDTTATSGETATTTSGNSNTGTEASSTSEASSTDTTVTTEETDTTMTSLDDLTTTTTTDSFMSTAETALSDTAVTTTRTDTTNTATLGEPKSAVTDAFTSTNQATSTDVITISTEMGTSTTITSGSSATSTTETASKDTTVTTSGTDTSGSTTSGEPTSTATDTFTSTTEATSEITLTSSQTGTPTTTTSGDLITTDTASFSTTTEATSTASETTTAAVPACTPGHLISPPPQGLECGKKGAPDDTNNIPGDHDKFAINIEACYNACMETPECGSIIFEEDVICSLRKGKPGETDGTDTGFKWYDTGCFCNETPTEPEPTCTNNLKSPAPANKICGKTGYVGYTYTGQGATNSLEACAKSCKSSNQCTSFTFEADTVCFLYSGALEERNGLSTTWMLYELDCFCDLDKPDPEPEPESQCVNGVKDPAPKDTVCGLKGSPNEAMEEYTSQANTLEDCRNECTTLEDCGSFAFDSSVCTLYTGHISTEGIKETQNGKTWYDRSCFCEPEEEPEPEPACVDNSPMEKVCGMQGWPGNTCMHWQYSSKVNSLEDCKETCKTRDCDSFSFREDNGLCEVFIGRVGGTDDFKSPWKWYDKACFEADNTTTEPEPKCANGLKEPLPKNTLCGAIGMFATGGAQSTGNGPVDSLDNCFKACKARANCQFFVFEQGNSCYFYKSQSPSTDGQTSSWKWYDKNCFCDNDPETNQPEPTPQCVNNVLQPSLKDSVCGKTGNPTGQGLEEIGSATATSLRGCRDACHKEAGCDSFQLEEGFNCYLFKGKVGATDGRTTAEVWYDMSCFCDLEAQANNPEEEEVCVDEVHKTQVCGLEGRPMYECIQEVPEDAPNPAAIKSLEACRDHCKSLGCDSFAFKKDHTCLLWKGPIGGAEARNEFPGVKMYDMSCFAEEPTKDVCIGEPLTPLPANAICGKPGDIDTNTLSNKRLETDTTLAQCSKACKAAGDCDVFNFHNQRCELYKSKSPLSSASVAFTGSTIQWWQPSCFCDDTKTDPKDPEPVCVNNMLSPAPKNRNCGATGSILTEDLSLAPIGMGDESSLESLKACSNACKAFDGCESFIFLEQNWCMFLAASVGPTDGSATEHAYYDMSCFCDGTKTEEPKKEEPAPVCKGEPKNPPPQNTVCGEKKGIRAGVSNYKSAQPPGSLKDCNIACKNTAGCDAFYWKENQMCVLQSGKPSPSDFTGSVGEVEWWVPSCFCEESEPEKTTGPAGTCQNNMLTPTPQGLACGKTGIPIGDSNVQQVGQGTANTPLACYQLCKNTARCQTMYFHKDTGDCQLYSGAVKNTNSATTSFVWYDKGCFCDSS